MKDSAFSRNFQRSLSLRMQLNHATSQSIISSELPIIMLKMFTWFLFTVTLKSIKMLALHMLSILKMSVKFHTRIRGTH